MRILFLLPRFHTNLHVAVAGLRARGHEVAMYCAEAAPHEDYSDVRPEVLRGEQLGYAQLSARLQALRPDLIVMRQREGHWRRFRWLALRPGAPKLLGYDLRPYFASTARGERPQGWLRSLREGRPARRMTPVLRNARSGRHVDPRAFYVPLPVAAPAEAAGRGYAPEGVLRVLCVGKLAAERKRHFLLIEALQQLPSLPFELTIVGSSSSAINHGDATYRERLLGYARHGALAPKISIAADVPYAAMRALYLRHDVCVLPASGEPLGMAPLEAAGCGCVPVVSTDCGSAASLTSDRDSLIFPGGDVAALSAALLRLFQEAGTLQRLGRGAYRFAREELDSMRFVERLEQIAAAL